MESLAIAFILLLNAGLGVYQETRAEAALAHLKALAESVVWVLRGGRLVHLPATHLVPGDVARIEAGDRMPADGRLVEAQGVMVDESVLTGESVPVEKELGGEGFSGTLVVRGKGYLEVTRTGAESAMGKLAVMLGSIEAEKTPLERRLSIFGAQIARWILLLAVVIALGGLIVEGLSRFGHVLLFKPVKHMPVHDADAAFFAGEDDGVGFPQTWNGVAYCGSDNAVSGTRFKHLPQFGAVFGIRP